MACFLLSYCFVSSTNRYHRRSDANTMNHRIVTLWIILLFLAGAVCTASAASRLPLQHAVTTESVIAKMDRQERVTLVDVRQQREFEQFHIPDSINIPLFAVKTKRFLQHAPIVLIDEGYQPATLDAVCEQLRQAGFDAGFLFGGLTAWRAQEGILTGDIFAQEAVNLMPPQVFLQEQHAPYWLVLDVSSAHTPALFPQAVHLPRLRDPDQGPNALRTIIANRESQPWLAILVIDERGEGYSLFQQILCETSLSPIFFLHGGRQAYRQSMKMQTAIQQESHATITEEGACTR